MQRKTVITIVTIAVLVLLIYYYGKTKGRSIPLPSNGSGIPYGWSAVVSVEKLRGAMDGLGTDENAIFETLEPMTRDQLAAIYNEYEHRTGENLFDRFREELSSGDLTRALYYFKDVI
jgi:hypothetical protein